MKKIRQNGFVMLLVIAVIAVISAATYVLADGANIMLFQSDTAYLEACERNLVASGLAWAKWNIKNESKESLDKTVKLDVTDMNIRDAALSVTIGVPRDKEIEVQINTSCSRGRRTFINSDKYRISL
jgi:hypothetical protein